MQYPGSYYKLQYLTTACIAFPPDTRSETMVLTIHGLLAELWVLVTNCVCARSLLQLTPASLSAALGVLPGMCMLRCAGRAATCCDVLPLS